MQESPGSAEMTDRGELDRLRDQAEAIEASGGDATALWDQFNQLRKKLGLVEQTGMDLEEVDPL